MVAVGLGNSRLMLHFYFSHQLCLKVCLARSYFAQCQIQFSLRVPIFIVRSNPDKSGIYFSKMGGEICLKNGLLR